MVAAPIRMVRPLVPLVVAAEAVVAPLMPDLRVLAGTEVRAR